MTVFFSDLEGFTASSEKLRPEEVVELLNDYFTEMSRLVREHGGQVDKFMGDGLMAFWGAPVRTPRHALLACEAALAMRAAVSARQEGAGGGHGGRGEERVSRARTGGEPRREARTVSAPDGLRSAGGREDREPGGSGVRLPRGAAAAERQGRSGAGAGADGPQGT